MLTNCQTRVKWAETWHNPLYLYPKRNGNNTNPNFSGIDINLINYSGMMTYCPTRFNQIETLYEH